MTIGQVGLSGPVLDLLGGAHGDFDGRGWLARAIITSTLMEGKSCPWAVLGRDWSTIAYRLRPGEVSLEQF
jgi:hypothetical protein